MILDDVVEMQKPDSVSQYRLKDCSCGSGEVVNLLCKDPFGLLEWRVKCMSCGADTICRYPIKHNAQIAWNTGVNIIKP